MAGKGASNFRVNTNLAQEIILATAGLLSGQAITVISDIRDKVNQPLSGREVHRKVVEMGNLQHPSRERGDSARVCEGTGWPQCTLHACLRKAEVVTVWARWTADVSDSAITSACNSIRAGTLCKMLVGFTTAKTQESLTASASGPAALGAKKECKEDWRAGQGSPNRRICR